MSVFTDSVRFNFLYIGLYKFGRTWVYPESSLPYCMLRYIVKGSAVFFVDGKEILVRQGDIIYLPKGVLLSCHALEDDFEFYSIRFVASAYYEGGDLLSDYYHVPIVTSDCGDEIKEYFAQIYERVRTQSRSKMFWVRGYLELLIGYLVGRVDQRKEEDVTTEDDTDSVEWLQRRIRKSDVKVDARIQLVVDYLVTHPTEQYTTKKMCELSGLSESRFRTLFYKQTGKNPLEYLNELRVVSAARKLLISGDNISDIAYSLGFHDVNYFIRVFKKYFCMTPKQYRDRARE